MKIEKGQFGYRTAHRKKQIKTIAGFLAVIGILLVSRTWIPREDIDNLVTISAILLVLPMANLASPMFAAWKIQQTPEDLHQKLLSYEEHFPVLYDLIITSHDFIMPIDAAVVHPTGVYLYCPVKSMEVRKGEKFLNEMLIGWKLDGNAKIMLDQARYLEQIASLKEVTEEEDDGSAPHVVKLLKSLSM